MRKIITLTLSILLGLNVLAVPSHALLNGSKEAVCKGVLLNEDGSCAAATAQSGRVDGIIKTALNLFSAIIGIIGVVMIIIAGLKYVTSQGEAAQVNSAKNTALYAAIGLVVAAVSQVLVRFVLSRFD